MQDFSNQPSLTETWIRYNQVRLSGDKKTANKLLTTYIQLLKQQPAADIRRIVDELCHQILDKSDDVISNNGYYASEGSVRIQHPLFKEIILPVLTEQYFRESARHIKWIGQLEQFFYSDASTSLSFLKSLNLPFPFMALHFFEKSYTIDPQQHTLKLILAKMAQTINYFFTNYPMLSLPIPTCLLIKSLRSVLTVSRQTTRISGRIPCPTGNFLQTAGQITAQIHSRMSILKHICISVPSGNLMQDFWIIDRIMH